VSVNDKAIQTTRDLDQAAKQESRTWRLVLMRGGQRLAVQFGG
jgi:hypothetical protein